MFNHVVGVPGHKLHFEEAELAVDIIQFVYDGANVLVFLVANVRMGSTRNMRTYVYDNLPDDLLERQVFISEIEMC